MTVSQPDTTEVTTVAYQRLRDLRKSKGISAKHMADLLGLVTKAAYYKKESGMTRFTLHEARIIAQRLGTSIDELFFADEVSCRDTKADTETVSQYFASDCLIPFDKGVAQSNVNERRIHPPAKHP
nr:helix-turn-helix transcriptional regulator [Syntrophothermus lipocalidus]